LLSRFAPPSFASPIGGVSKSRRKRLYRQVDMTAEGLAAVDEVGDPATGRSRRHCRAAKRPVRTFLVCTLLTVFAVFQAAIVPPIAFLSAIDSTRDVGRLCEPLAKRSTAPFCCLHYRVRRRERSNNEVRRECGDFGVIPGPGVFSSLVCLIRVPPVLPLRDESHRRGA
jgi:hypothetical protein